MTTNRNLNNNYYKIKTIVIIPIFYFLGKRYSCLVSHMIMFAKHVCQSMESLIGVLFNLSRVAISSVLIFAFFITKKQKHYRNKIYYKIYINSF